MKCNSFLSAALLIGCFQVLTAQAQVRINEFMASNVNTIADPDFGDTGDWIELHNAGLSSVDLGGYFLTDDLAQSAKWQIPAETVIEPDGYLLIWADDAATGLHTNFKLTAAGEEIGLFDPAGMPVDAVIFDMQTADVSFGLLDNNPGVWRFLETSTPGEPNDNAGFLGFTQPVTFSIVGGFHNGPQSIALSTASTQGTIRYTTDGAPPTENSPVYSAPIAINATGVIRASVFQQDHLPSPVATQTYLIDEPTDLPVFSIATHPDNLWSDASGIYVEGTNGILGNCAEGPRNWNQDWEHPANVEFFESDRSPTLNQGIGIEIFGGCSRLYDQKSLSLLARNRYGKGKMKHRFFDDKNIDAFESLLLRSSGQDWFRTMFRDGMIQTVITASIDIDHQAYRPAILFLNGEYWGIHNIREKTNAELIVNNHGYPEGEFDYLETFGSPIRGTPEHYNQLIDFVSSSDMTRDDNLAFVNTMMDVDYYIDYQAVQIYIANADWPSGNIKFWRPRTFSGRWRWVLFDTDLSFGGNSNGKFFSNTLQQATDDNGPDWPNPPWSTLLFRKLLENRQFKDRFTQRLASHINITFDSTYVHHVVDSLRMRIENEVPRHEERWEQSIGFNTPWNVHVGVLKEFPVERPAQLRMQVAEQFGYDASVEVQVSTNVPGRGHVYVSDVRMRTDPFSGLYFEDLPLELRAVPLPGYKFMGWDGDLVSSTDSVEIQLDGPVSITAVFESDGSIIPTEDAAPAYRFHLHQSYPNPFSTTATISFEIPESANVSLRVYDLLGREVVRVLDAHVSAGPHLQQISRGQLAAGVYVYELRTENEVSRKTFTVVK